MRNTVTEFICDVCGSKQVMRDGMFGGVVETFSIKVEGTSQGLQYEDVCVDCYIAVETALEARRK